ncbi:MAG: outer membrane protein [Phycisphaerales bacterium]|jgi:outer membrane protein TolC|nr:outer membrane protein [Phycisphaerales bacterium]
MNNFRYAALLSTFACAFASSLLPGCRDAGRGGTGEIVVPRETLREIESSDPADFALAPPTTAPTTLPSTRPAATQPLRDVKLTIEEVRQLALKNNLDLHVDLFAPAIARENLNAAEAGFESLFTSSIDYSTSDTPTATQLEGSQGKNLRIAPGVRVPLRTGGEIRFDAPISRSETNNQFSTLNPAYASDLAATLSQPLLRGGGVYVNTQSIRIAFYGYQQQQARTKLEVIRVLTDADRVYWRLYAAREALIVRRQEYDLAVQQLQRARNQVAAGAAAEVEIIRAQSGVADRVESIITADNLVRDRERELKRILNTPDLDLQSPTALVTATLPRPMYYQVDTDRMIAQSLGRRMDLLDLELQIAADTAEIRVARNATLPLVSLAYTYNMNGLGGTLDDAFTMARGNDFVDHRIGVQVEIPIGNEVARSRLRRSLLQRLQTLATREQRELQIRQEVLNAIDQLEANWQRILAARQRVLSEARVLEVEIRQFEQGLRTSTEVLEAQTRLANAKLSEISAVTDYEIAQVDIAFATGTVLGASRVTWEPAPTPKP